jgi:hypothetical protein
MTRGPECTFSHVAHMSRVRHHLRRVDRVTRAAEAGTERAHRTNDGVRPSNGATERQVRIAPLRPGTAWRASAEWGGTGLRADFVKHMLVALAC